MKKMNMPGFTAESALVKTKGVYASGATPLAAHFSGEFDGRGAVMAALTPCRVDSDCKCDGGTPVCIEGKCYCAFISF